MNRVVHAGPQLAAARPIPYVVWTCESAGFWPVGHVLCRSLSCRPPGAMTAKSTQVPAIAPIDAATGGCNPRKKEKGRLWGGPSNIVARRLFRCRQRRCFRSLRFGCGLSRVLLALFQNECVTFDG